MDRVARSLSVQMALIAALESEGVALLSAATGQDVVAEVRDDPMREAMVLVQGVFAQVDRKMTVRKLRAARDRKREAEGRCEGVKPYGTLPGEDKAMAIIRRGRRGRRPWSRIAEELNNAEHRTRGRKHSPPRPWTGEDVRTIWRRRRR